jgi:hypothetical protein
VVSPAPPLQSTLDKPSLPLETNGLRMKSYYAAAFVGLLILLLLQLRNREE